MSIKFFFRLPIFSFTCTFMSLFFIFMMKINELNQENIVMNYNFSPDFMKIVGMGLYVLTIMAICLHRNKIYTLNVKNAGITIFSVLVALIAQHYSDIAITDIAINQFNLTEQSQYHHFSFWLPIISRPLDLAVIAVVLSVVIPVLKLMLKLDDEKCPVDLTNMMVSRQLHLIIFSCFYLAFCFVFQRYLYIAIYLYLGSSELSEYHNFSFYLASVVTITALAIYISQSSIETINSRLYSTLTPVLLILLSQIVASVVVCWLLIYGIQYYYQVTVPSDGAMVYAHYVSFLYAMLNSIFIAAMLTAILTYIAGRFWVRKFYGR